MSLISYASILTIATTLTLSGATFAQDNKSAPLSLHQAVSIAVENNPSLLQTKETIHQAQEQTRLSSAIVFPTLNLIGTGSYEKSATNSPSGVVSFNGDPYNQYESDLHLTQTLFQIGTFSAIESTKKDQELRKLDTEIAARNLTSNVIQAYYQVILNSRNVDTLVRQERIEKEALVTATQRERTGRGQLLDVLQVKTQIALLESQIATAKNSLQVSAATLDNLLGGTKAAQITVRDGLEGPQLDSVDRNVDLKNFRLPELEQNKISYAQLDDQKNVYLGQNLPSLALTGDYLYNAYKKSDLFNQDANSWIVSLQLTIPLFSGLSGIYQQHVLTSEQAQLEFAKTNIMNNTTLQQVTSRKNLESALQTIISGTDALKLAIASSDEARRQYRLATIDFVALLNVENSYVQAESSLNGYKYNYIVALANYYVASGQQLGGLVDLLEGANP